MFFLWGLNVWYFLIDKDFQGSFVGIKRMTHQNMLKTHPIKLNFRFHKPQQKITFYTDWADSKYGNFIRIWPFFQKLWPKIANRIKIQSRQYDPFKGNFLGYFLCFFVGPYSYFFLVTQKKVQNSMMCFYHIFGVSFP